MTSTPGYCVLNRLGSTNKEIFGWDGLKCDFESYHFVKSCVRARFDQLLEGKEYADEINLFIKQEPHKRAKLDEGRERLISGISLIDNMVDRVLFGWLQRQMLNKVGKTPCLVGWSPVKGGWRSLSAHFAGKPVVCIDKKCWDWTVPEWMVEDWTTFLLNVPVGAPEWWNSMVRVRMKLLFYDARFRFKDGTVVKQRIPGIMKSGCLLTILLNSVGQSLLHYLAYIRLGLNPKNEQPLTIGDDTVQRSVKSLREYVRIMESFGFELKGCKVRHWIEFAGFAFNGWKAWPAYWQKHIYNLQYTPFLEEVLHAYQYLYCHEPVMFGFLQRLACQVGPEVALSEMEARAIMDGE